MSLKITFSDAKNSRLPASIGACPTDLRFRDLLNEAQERLLFEGHYAGTTAPFRFCATDGCITFPPQIDTLETIAVCGVPGRLRTQWYEFLEGGWGMRTQQSGGNGSCGSCAGGGAGGGCMAEAIDRGRFPVFGDIIGTDKKLNFTCDLLSDVGKKVLALGYDANGNWIRTVQNGVVADGEIILLAQNAGTNSVNFFSAVTDIQFNEARDGQVWGYEFNTTNSTKRMIGKYEYFETRPNYRRYLFPSIRSGTADPQTGACSQTIVQGIAKLAFIPVKNDNDYLILPCLPALKDMIGALNHAENEPDSVKKNQIILAGIQTATRTLDKQLQSETGDGPVIGINILGSSIGELDPVVPLY